jgi:segregation and condensation protein B
VESLFAHMTLKQVVEALVFASPKPLTTKEILAALKAAGEPSKSEDQTALDYAKAKEADVLAALGEIDQELKEGGRAFRLQEQVNGWSFVTDPGAVQWIRKLYPEAKPTRLSGPQLETLAIVAYRQPVTRADIEAVRGVAVDGVVQVLLERSLIKIAGRADVPGRPLLYETTEYFLQHFGIKSVDELPNAAELKRVELPKAAPEPAQNQQAMPGTEGQSSEAAPSSSAEVSDAEASPLTQSAPEPLKPVAEEDSTVESRPEA